ncbi:hypothetical protein D2V08_15645 [Flagellimonas lutimaris]|uniref:SGNH/GDSL hydrolase family protein n=1 Tax=Flagellimonas lutimaris TaxID=475082 RepID=A0A3A1N9A6_9FLAO|nr:hypothetical protein [Allomuricauda lutimaris]RIV30522.1 hypothetical protein D2V08_15645 [Allomuricauda lutimaris]
MIKLLGKILLYGVLVLIALEILVRVFHLYPEDPPRFIDELNVEKRVPGYTGYSVTGNRRQNFSEFRINKQGFNSYRNFNPSESKNELALIGDSFIQGFHEEYDQSIGKKIDQKVDGLEVYEYGYAGWDMADQLHLINAYKQDFEKIDHIVIYMDYPSDFHRATYEPNYKRIKLLNSTVFKLRNNIKLFYYASEIGMLDSVKRFVSGKTKDSDNEAEEDIVDSNEKDEAAGTYISNFDSLLKLYPIEKNKTSFLLDFRTTPKEFLSYCRENNIKVIDFGKLFEKSKVPVTLIYDQHWNTHGRSLVAKSIVKSLYPHQEH